MLKKTFLSLILILIGRRVCHAQQQHGDENHTQESKICVSREEFDSLQKELDYWQNTTINILNKYMYLIDNEAGREASHCPVSDDSYLKEKVEELEQKVEGILNNTQGVRMDITIVSSKIENLEKLEQKIEGILNNTQGVRMEVSSITSKIENLEGQLGHSPLGTFLNPAPSCQLIPQGSPSGHYWIQNAGTGYANMEYCDMTRRCCNSTGGWTRVAHLDMTDTNQHCPSGFRLITLPKRSCSTPGSRCVSTTFPLSGIKYSRVCGKIIGYQYSSVSAFQPYYNNQHYTIDSQYVEGVSLTHGQSPRKHIWTFAAAISERRSNNDVCPCTKTDTSYTGVVPLFIGQDYFCDTGSRYAAQRQWYHADPLWDGSGCGSTSSCCGFNNPPWFCKQLPQPTTDDIEMRVCVDQDINNEDIALESVEIYVQ